MIDNSDIVLFEANDLRDKMSLVVSRDPVWPGSLYFNLKLRQFRSFKSKLAVIREYLFNNEECISQELILTNPEIVELRDILNEFLEERAAKTRNNNDRD
jgi:hypothetical protein